MTGVRQPGEWMNRDVVQNFERLRAILKPQDDLNAKHVLAAVLVHNWRVSHCDRNQVKKVFLILKKEGSKWLRASQKKCTKEAFFSPV